MKKKGFSLIELMVVIVIVGILASIAVPSYKKYVIRARRADGQSALLLLNAKMERYYSDHNTYATATIGTGNANTDLSSSTASPNGWYTLSISTKTASSYTLRATPVGAQGTNDTECQSFTINNIGTKAVTIGPAGVPTAAANVCWGN